MAGKLIAMLLMRDPQFMQRLSEARPIRWAAKKVAYMYLRGQQALEERARSGAVESGRQGLASFGGRFKQEVKKGMAEAMEEFKSGRRKL